MKLVTEEYGRGGIERIQGFVTTSLALLCISSGLTLTVILFLKNLIVAVFRLSDDNAMLVSGLLPYIGALTVCVFIVQAINATVSGLGRMDLANYILSGSKANTIAGIIQGNREIINAFRVNDLKIPLQFFWRKPLLKISQLFKKQSRNVSSKTKQSCF